MIREAITEIWVQLLVGYDEESKERLRQLLIDNIMVYLSRWDAQNRREAVLDLVERIKRGKFQIVEQADKDLVDARARNRDHGKVYILDETLVLSGSANLTVNGLRFNSENLTLVDAPDRVSYYLNQFQEYWEAEDTVDLTQALLDALLKWLQLSPPFDIYLKTIQVLIQEEEVEPPRENYKMPVNYQLVVIERLLRQLKAFRGAMLVASTGLGKTVMATHAALRLARTKRIDNIIVFSPLQVQLDWKHALRSAGLGNEIFTRDLLDRPGKIKGKKMLEMEDALQHIDGGYLVIIDESQYFRNKTRAKDGRKRHSFNRLIPVIQEKEALVLLLTATPFSKEVNDLNHQLQLLPHTADKKFVKPDGQFVFPGMIDDDIAPEAWKVMEGSEFFDDFIKLPVTTVISTSQVAKDFAEHTEEGDYIFFGEEKRWVPQVEVTKVKVPVYLEEDVSAAMERGVFLHKHKSFRDRKQQWRRSDVIVQNKAEIAWMSSPLALEKVLEDALFNTDKVIFRLPDSQREELLEPILSKIRQHGIEEDPKFQALSFYLKEFQKQSRKVIIFTERQLTAIYLEKALKRSMPFLRVGNTIKETGEGTELKNFDQEVLPIIKGFAPVANADKISTREKLSHFDVLIATDAYSTGVNLQDASVVINYDLAWTPDVLIQRAGRILRFWKEPRRVHFLVFVGDFQKSTVGKQKTHNVENRLRKLSLRSKQAQKFSEIPIIPESDRESYQSLGSLSAVTQEDIGLVDISQLEEFSGVSPFLRHIAVLKEHEQYADQIPNDIASAMYYDGHKQLIYLLFLLKAEYFHVLYDVKKNSIEPIKEDELLDLIQCTPQTAVANIGADEVELWAQKGRRLWEQQIAPHSSEDVERICACYLIPRKMEKEFRNFMEGRI